MKLYLILLDITTNKQFRKYFDCEYDMDKFINKLKYSRKLAVIKDSREEYFLDYNR